MAIDFGLLKAELELDPAGLGYAEHIAAGSDHKLAKLLNRVWPGASVERQLVPSYEVLGVTEPGEWAALTAAEKQRYQLIISAGQIDVKNQNIRAAFGAMFGAGSVTRAALLALQQRTGSRAEFLFGAGVMVTDQDVAQALRGDL